MSFIKSMWNGKVHSTKVRLCDRRCWSSSKTG